MQYVSFSMVKDEADIVESFIRYNLKYLDHMFILENMSTDGTKQILAALQDEGLPITIVEDREQKFSQGNKITKFYKKIFNSHDIDVAFFLDADEFLDINRDVIDNDMATLGKGRAFYIRRRQHVYVGEFDSDYISPLNAMNIVRPGYESSKSLIFHDDELCSNFTIGDGSHHVRDKSRDSVKVSEEKADNAYGIIRHYPIRSIDQYIKKNILGWLSMQLMSEGVNEAEKPIGVHWRKNYREIIKRQFNINSNDLKIMLYGKDYESKMGDICSMNYNFPIKYSHLKVKQNISTHLVHEFETAIANMWENK